MKFSYSFLPLFNLLCQIALFFWPFGLVKIFNDSLFTELIDHFNVMGSPFPANIPRKLVSLCLGVLGQHLEDIVGHLAEISMILPGNIKVLLWKMGLFPFCFLLLNGIESWKFSLLSVFWFILWVIFKDILWRIFFPYYLFLFLLGAAGDFFGSRVFLLLYFCFFF